jgi:hypothetical protein
MSGDRSGNREDDESISTTMSAASTVVAGDEGEQNRAHSTRTVETKGRWWWLQVKREFGPEISLIAGDVLGASFTIRTLIAPIFAARSVSRGREGYVSPPAPITHLIPDLSDYSDRLVVEE